MVEPIEVGLESINFILIDVHSEAREEWADYYENDHFFAGGVLGAGVLAGRRWYAPRELRSVRFGSTDCPYPDLTAGSVLTTFFLNRPRGADEFLEWVGPQVAALDSVGRMFRRRDIVNVGIYPFQGLAGGAGPFPPHVAPLYPWGGLFVTLVTSGTGGADPSGTAAPPAGAMTLALGRRPFETLPEHRTQPDLNPFEPVTMLITFLQGAPLADAAETAALARAVAREVGGRPFWAGGFLPIVPGDRTFLSTL